MRITDRQDEDLRATAEGLGMDVSNLVRLLLVEHLPEYTERAEGAARRADAARTKLGRDAQAAKRSKDKPGTNAKPSRNSIEQGVRNLDL